MNFRKDLAAEGTVRQSRNQKRLECLKLKESGSDRNLFPRVLIKFKEFERKWYREERKMPKVPGVINVYPRPIIFFSVARVNSVANKLLLFLSFGVGFIFRTSIIRQEG